MSAGAKSQADVSEHQGYEPLPAHLDLPEMDRAIIEQWRANKVFERSLGATAGGEAWTFYEGPPTANGMPGTHHVEARVFKDVFPRFKTMQGYHVARMAGWLVDPARAEHIGFGSVLGSDRRMLRTRAGASLMLCISPPTPPSPRS